MSKSARKEEGKESLLRGNWGEQYIAEKLSSCGCFVRHVPQGHDTGIDLYCETTTDSGDPFLHFWCQVKASKSYKGKKRSITFRPEKAMHKEYWLKQPVPVFIFLVPDLRKRENIPYYIFSSIDFYPTNEKISSLTKVEKQQDLENFLKTELLIQSFRWDLMLGKVTYLATEKPQYTIHFPKDETLKFESKIETSLRWTLRCLCNDILDSDGNQLNSKIESYAHMLETLALGTNDKHYDTYEVLGRYYKSINNIRAAKSNYKKSLDLIHNDQKINTEIEPWKSTVGQIEEAMNKLKTSKKNHGNSEIIETKDVCATQIPNDIS
jgi:hypothetical protein